MNESTRYHTKAISSRNTLISLPQKLDFCGPRKPYHLDRTGNCGALTEANKITSTFTSSDTPCRPLIIYLVCRLLSTDSVVAIRSRSAFRCPWLRRHQLYASRWPYCLSREYFQIPRWDRPLETKIEQARDSKASRIFQARL